MTHDESTKLVADEGALTALVPLWDSGEETLVFPASGRFTCGSAPNSAAKVSMAGVADRHCRVLCGTDQVKIEPFGRHRVTVNDIQVLGSRRLNAGDQVSIGPAAFRVEKRRQSFGCRVNVFDADEPEPEPTLPPVASSIQISLPVAQDAPADSINQQIADLELRLAEAQTPKVNQPTPPPLPLTSFSTPPTAMPVLASATQDNLRRLLDAREAQLTEWQASLEVRCAELDNRSTTLARQQASLSDRQSKIEKRAAELQIWQEETARTLKAQSSQATEEARREIQQQKARLAQRDEELSRERSELDAQTERLEASKQSVAEQLKELAEARRALAGERKQYIDDQKKVAAELEVRARNAQGRESVLKDQQEKLAARAKQVSDLEAARAKVAEDASSLEVLSAELNARAEELQHLETVRSEVSEREAALERRETELSQLAQELQRLEGVQQEITERETALQQQTAELQPQIQALHQLETLRAEIGERESAMQDRHTSLEAEARQLATAASEVAAEWQRIEETRQQLSDVDEKLNLLTVRVQETDQQQAQLDLLREELDGQNADLQSRTEAFNASVAAFEQQQAHLDHSREELRQQEETIAAERLALAKVNTDAEQILTASNELTTRETALNELAVELETKREELSARAAELKELSEALDTKTTHIAEEAVEWEKKQATDQQCHAEMEAQLEELQTTVVEREFAVTEREAELESLAEQLQTQATELQQLANAPETSSQIESLTQQLAEAHTHSAGVVAERDELQTAVEELRAALETVHDELAASTENPVSDDSTDTKIESLQVELSQRDAELTETRQALADQQQVAEELQHKLVELAERFDAERAQLQSDAQQQSVAEHGPADADGSKLLLQIEELKAELEAAADGSEKDQDVTNQLQQYENTIAELTQKLEEAQQQSNDPPADNVGDSDDVREQYRAVIEQLTQKVEEQNATIETLQNSDTESRGETSEEIKTLHRELDDRTIVLDKREEEMREQQRMLEQSTEELEEQRRAMLEARQQLELARAEIQVAHTQQNDVVEKNESAGSLLDHFKETESESHYDDTLNAETVEEATPAVRSEIAELFGLGGGTDSEPSKPFEEERTVTTPAELMEAVDDYSQETQAAVSMSFSEAENVLLPPVTDESADDAALDAATSEEEHDDFVSQYMEQLLARNRESAGDSLPAELTNPSASSSSPPLASLPAATPLATPETAEQPAKEEPSKPPGSVSFIEQYMSGSFGDNGDSSTGGTPQATPAADPDVPARPMVPRAKVDVDAMRNNMQSFRELSTKSVENALATHAKQQRRGGIANRSSLFIALAAICVFTVAASLMGVIPFGIFTWISIIAAALAGVDLMLKMGNSKSAGAQIMGADDRFATAGGKGQAAAGPQVALHAPAAEAVSTEVTPEADAAAKEPPDEPEEQYFEL